MDSVNLVSKISKNTMQCFFLFEQVKNINNYNSIKRNCSVFDVFFAVINTFITLIILAANQSKDPVQHFRSSDVNDTSMFS